MPQPPPLTRRQRDILAFFESYTSAQGISPTLEEIARHFGLNKVTIFGHVAELERKGCLRRAAPGISRGLQIVRNVGAPTPSMPILVLGEIAAGEPIETLETPEALSLEDLAPPEKEVYALRVRGTSMIEDSIRDGDLVLVEKRANPSQGDAVIAVLSGEVVTLKRFYREPDGRIRLQPANENLEPTFTKEVEIRGVVIGVIRRY